MSAPLYAGTDIRVSFEVRDASGTLTSPTTVSCRHVLPNGSSEDVTATNDGTGLYHVDFTDVLSGNHKLVVTTTGTLGAKGTGTWYITPTNV